MADTVVVTGASGFIATEVCKQLLEKGYIVRGTVRSTSDAKKVAHLKALGDALPGTLTLHEADLLKEGSFDEVVKGAKYVLHLASPFIRVVEDAQRDLVDPAVKGTTNVLESVAKSLDTVKKVVLTSSFASVVKPKAGPFKELYDEEDWNNESTIEDNPYRFSKVEAEKVGWALSKKYGFPMCTINPTFVLGPVVSSRTDATSIKDMTAFIENTGSDMLAWVCDVRDIAKAHILAAETPSATGRFLVSQGTSICSKAVSDVLSARFPQYKFPPGTYSPPKAVIDNSKVQRELGMQITPWERSVVDMATTLIQLGVAKPVPAKEA